jgi:DNA-binding beta-propeller fold protein YncE
VLVYNAKTQVVEKDNFITDGTAITSPYAIAYDSLTEQLFVADAKNYSTNGSLYAFNKSGAKVEGYPITTGINPGAIVFVNK